MISIDLSLRSTGLVSLNDSTLELEDFEIISNPELNNEELIIENCRQITDFVERNYAENICIEGLSFGSISSTKDLLFGQFWLLRTKLYKIGNLHIIPVQRWRCRKIFSKEEHEYFKGMKDGLKWMVVDKVPGDVTFKFNEYIMKKNLKDKALFDLCDAYMMAYFQIKTLEDSNGVSS